MASRSYKLRCQDRSIVAAFKIVLLISVMSKVSSRRHSLMIENDARRNFAVSTFGFLKGGGLMIDIIYVSPKVEKPSPKVKLNNLVGFSLEKTGSDGVSSYMEQHTDKCVLQERDGLAKQVEMMLFTLDFSRKKIIVERFGPSFKTLNVSNIRLPDQAWYESSLLDYVRKLLPKLGVDIVKTIDATPSGDNKNKTRKVRDVKKPDVVSLKEGSHRQELPLNLTGNMFAGTITIIINEGNEGLYNLYFHNCYTDTPVKIDMKLRIIEHNKDTFLAAGEIPLPTIYGVISVIFFIAGCVYLSILRKLREWTFKIHYLMAVVVFLKSFSLIFHAINYYYIGKDGRRMESWAVLFYITHLLKGALMFTCIVLIGTGFFFVKQVLSTKEKRIFMIVIPLQILANVASIMIDSTEEGKAQYKTWNQIFILVDLICCGTVLFPVVWSIRHLQEASKTDGKAAISLAKLKLFRHFYVLIVCYIYFTRIIVYLIKITVPFNYIWLDPLCTELASLLFFVVTGYKFRPAASNPYLHVPEEDEDVEMDEISIQSGLADGITRVNMKPRKNADNFAT
ncbi:protein GPR107-like [Rhopilema esculentum]|uniref:protein GPR107-like n=1 Tax=Rhopilema esculentum TaxID=499914 RepID=UPI0031DBF375